MMESPINTDMPENENTTGDPAKEEANERLSSRDLLELLRRKLAEMTDQDRLEIFDALTDGYCKHCGRDDSESFRGCQCWNDD